MNLEKSQQKQPPTVPEKESLSATPFPGLKPKGLDFNTPKSSSLKSRENSILMTPEIPETPATPTSNIFDVESLVSEASSVTPEMSKLTLGRSRGRPRKAVEKPTMDDFPYDWTKEEQKRYIAKKNTEMWRYKKLTSSDSAEYRKAEAQRVKCYNQRKRKQGEETDDSTESTKEKKRKQPRER